MPKFTAGELKVMQLLWQHGELKPAELQELYPEPIKNDSRQEGPCHEEESRKGVSLQSQDSSATRLFDHAGRPCRHVLCWLR